jgi:hypothetical protein
VVTGYFDPVDTVFSIRHAYEDLFEGSHDHDAPGHERMTTKVGKLVLAAVHEIRASTANGQPTQAQARAAVDAAVQRLVTGSTDPDVREAAQMILSAAVPGQVQDAFRDEVAGFAQAIPGSALSLMDVVLFIKTLSDAAKYPSELIRWLLADRLPAAWEEWVIEGIRQPFDQAVRSVVDHHIGRYRVGCHSLLGKDYSVEDDELTRLFRQAKNCAKALHWYVIKTLIRSSEQRQVSVSRADPDSGSDTQVNHVDRPRTIDWLELLETLLRHPHEMAPPNEPPWWQPVIEGSWRNFPGYNRTTPTRAATLPHVLVPSTRAVRDGLIREGANMRSAGETTYDSSASRG